ncbi:MAG: hypothetical protein EXR62_04750 [Chloroflexi bacterium]|nr:hypothetical protein [Chloroflexota bacterium]
MTKVAILPVSTGNGNTTYYAIAGDKQSVGKTPGDALDTLTAQLDEAETSTLVIIRHLRPDQYFDAQQRQRLSELMERWRAARDQGQTLPQEEQAELQALVEAELRASAARTAALFQELTR